MLRARDKLPRYQHVHTTVLCALYNMLRAAACVVDCLRAALCCAVCCCVPPSPSPQTTSPHLQHDAPEGPAPQHVQRHTHHHLVPDGTHKEHQDHGPPPAHTPHSIPQRNTVYGLAVWWLTVKHAAAHMRMQADLPARQSSLGSMQDTPGSPVTTYTHTCCSRASLLGSRLSAAATYVQAGSCEAAASQQGTQYILVHLRAMQRLIETTYSSA